MSSYIYMFIAILLEVTGTMLLPISQNFTRLIPTVILFFCYGVSFFLLTLAIRTIPIAVVYATWSGLGIFTIAICGVLLFKQTLSWQVVGGLFLIVIGVCLVNIHSQHGQYN